MEEAELREILLELSGNELKTFLLIKSLYNENGGPVIIEYNEFQKSLNMSRGSVANNLKKLLAKGYIDRKIKNNSYLYFPMKRKDKIIVDLEERLRYK